MQTLKRAELTRIIALIKQRKASVKQGPLWASLSAELGIGEISADGRKIVFSAADREVLRRAVLQQTGFDPLVTALPDSESSNRQEMAGVINQEKFAYAPVGSERLMVTMPHGQLVINGSACSIPPETALWVDWRAVELAADQSLIIVENKLAFLNWHQCELPAELQSAVAVYRGDGPEARALINWLNALPADRIVGAYDFDPAGLAIARQQGVGSILVPAHPDRFLAQSDGALHKPRAFADQHQQHESNRKWVSGEVERLWCWMEEHGSSITQEAMLEAGETLKLVRL